MIRQLTFSNITQREETHSTRIMDCNQLNNSLAKSSAITNYTNLNYIVNNFLRSKQGNSLNQIIHMTTRSVSTSTTTTTERGGKRRRHVIWKWFHPRQPIELQISMEKVGKKWVLADQMFASNAGNVVEFEGFRCLESAMGAQILQPKDALQGFFKHKKVGFWVLLGVEALPRHCPWKEASDREEAAATALIKHLRQLRLSSPSSVHQTRKPRYPYGKFVSHAIAKLMHNMQEKLKAYCINQLGTHFHRLHLIFITWKWEILPVRIQRRIINMHYEPKLIA